MATSTDVQLVVQVVDKATAQLGVINKTIIETGKVSDEAHKKMAEGAKRSGEGLISLNQGLELAKKGFDAIKFAIEAPIRQFEALFDVSERLVRKYDEQFIAETKLTQAAKSTGNASSESVRQFRELADQLEKTTRFQSDAIISGQAMALSMGATSKIIPQVTQAALDLAAATGEDAAAGFQKLIQAVETGSLRTFGRAHIEFQKTGNTVLDFARASELAESKFRGLAQEVAKGGAGQLITVENAFDKIEKSLGKIIANSPQFQGFLKTVTDIFDELGVFIEQHGDELGNLFGAAFAASLNVALKALDLFIGALKLAGSLIFNMLEAMSHVPGLGVESPFADINKQINDLTKQRANLSGSDIPMNFKVISPEESRQIDELTRQIDALIQKKKELAKDPFGGTGLAASVDVFHTAAAKLSDELEEMFSGEKSFGARWKKNTAAQVVAIDEAKAHVETFAESAHSSLQDVVVQMNEIEKATKDYRGQAQFLSEILKGAGESGQDAFQKMGEALQLLLKHGDINEEQFGALVHTMKEGFSDATREIDKTDAALKKLNQDARSGGATAPGVPTAPGGAPAKGGAGGAAEAAVRGGGGSALDAAARAMSEAVVAAAAKLDAVAGNFDEPIRGLTDAGAAITLQAQAASDATAAISNAADALTQSSGVLLQSGAFMIAATKDAANAMITAASDLVTASGFLDKSFRQGNFPRLGFGGVPTGQTLATVGDRPEVILPLDDRGLAFAKALLAGKQGGGGGETVNVHINVDRMDLSDESMNDLARIVERRLADRVLESVRRG
jgi:hypothetical protein